MPGGGESFCGPRPGEILPGIQGAFCPQPFQGDGPGGLCVLPPLDQLLDGPLETDGRLAEQVWLELCQAADRGRKCLLGMVACRGRHGDRRRPIRAVLINEHLLQDFVGAELVVDPAGRIISDVTLPASFCPPLLGGLLRGIRHRQ